jgi:signal transduction histidine kinase
VTDTLKPTAAEKKIDLQADIPAWQVPADEKLLRRVLTNLVSNAIKFTEKGFVRIYAKQDEKCYFITVEDSGIGMSEQEIKGLFQKYHQIHADKPGYGLGLFISRQIVESHGGTLSVTSRPGEGSVFTITLPKEEK